MNKRLSKQQIKTKESIKNARNGCPDAQEEIETKLNARVWTQEEIDALNFLRSLTTTFLQSRRIPLHLPEGFLLPKTPLGPLEEAVGLWGVYLKKNIWLCRFQFEDGTIKDFLVKIIDPNNAEALGDVSEWTQNV